MVLAWRISAPLSSTSNSSSARAITPRAESEDHSSSSRKLVTGVRVDASVSSKISANFSMNSLISIVLYLINNELLLQGCLYRYSHL